MIDFIACVLLFTIFALCFYFERKEKQRKEYECWVYDCRQCLVRITNSFRRDCQTIAEETFTKYTSIIQQKSYRCTPDYMTYSFLSDYQKSIDSLKEDYIENVTIKAKEAMRHYTLTSIPDYLIEEYIKQLSDIYYSFRDFSYLMRKQIAEANEKI